jgi:hypothetical protein
MLENSKRTGTGLQQKSDRMPKEKGREKKSHAELMGIILQLDV